MSARLRINTPPVALETVDEETIIVNLDTGSYYSLDPVGSHVLLVLAEGGSPEGAVSAVAARWSVDAAAVAPSVLRVADELVAEEVLVPAGDAAPGAPPVPAEPSARPYADPALSKFTDMQELLLLDPVHEVDATGWPGRA